MEGAEVAGCWGDSPQRAQRAQRGRVVIFVWHLGTFWGIPGMGDGCITLTPVSEHRAGSSSLPRRERGLTAEGAEGAESRESVSI